MHIRIDTLPWGKNMFTHPQNDAEKDNKEPESTNTNLSISITIEDEKMPSNGETPKKSVDAKSKPDINLTEPRRTGGSGRTLNPDKKAKHRSLSPISRAQSVVTLFPKRTLRSLSADRRPVAERTAADLSGSQSFFSPITDRVYNAEALYAYFIDATLKSTQKITSYPGIPHESMLNINVQDLKDADVFQLGFTRKDCSYTPITHASLAFRDQAGRFLIVGRQNEQFLKPDQNNLDLPESSFLYWAYNNFTDYKAFFRFTTTCMDNEKKYEFFPGTLFNAEMTEVTMTGAEIKTLINSINTSICSAQYYDVVHSNCYSAVLFGLAKAFEMIAEKDDRESSEDEYIADNKNLKRLFTLICSALQDNYKMGSGAANNTVVNQAIQKMLDILEERHLVHIIDSSFEKESECKTCHSTNPSF